MKCLPLLILLVCCLTQACRNPTEGFELRFRKAYTPTLELQLQTKTGDLPPKIEMMLTGPESDRLVTTLYTKKFKVTTDGTIYLAVDTTFTPATATPLRFNVIAKADGFLDMVRSFWLTSKNYQQMTADLVRTSEAPAVATQTGQAGTDGTVSAAIVTQTTSQTSVNQTSLTIPANTQLSDIGGQPVGGGLTVRLNPINIVTTADAVAKLAITSDGKIKAPLTTTGKTARDQRILQVAGAASIDMYNSQFDVVKTFSKPATLSFVLNSKLYNPLAKRTVQAGDLIPMFSYDIARNQWRQENAGTVQTSPQGWLVCMAEISHLSDWVAAFTIEECAQPLTFTLKATPPPNSDYYTYKAELLDGNTNAVLRTFFTFIANGKKVTVSGLETNTYVKLRLADNFSSAVAVSAAVSGCTTTEVPLDLTAFAAAPVPPPPPPVDPNKPTEPTNPTTPTTPTFVTISLDFPCIKLDPDKLPTKELYARFRITGTNKWTTLPVLKYEAGKTSFSITTTLMKPGNTYDMEAGSAPGYYTFSQPAYKLDTYFWHIRIKTHEYCAE